ncbi:gamma-glutamyltransferase family protein [Anoxynatronum buryatiense]|uniref:Gamma-glutamyltransferase 2. Threonine peptidase. MEROPS family T03 n=1 Tax=Anoxynatronum buryatiense TaxID=489973 RepID=A0AA45WYP7_9CLOT|nr:gamma-glutamyltransferase family protein [Anoxynatronum buryatiense]SMP67871.1 gamma-glutamyltransferase 2. Threonine peptidase. MEROPS family T03 [Anoxynatronum buryatiense]
MNFSAQHYPYTSRRTLVYGQRGMVATSQPLAAQAGLDILKAGGNAVDAAIATAACLTVTEPTSNGIGGDAFAIVWLKDGLHGLNASGPAPAALSLEALQQRGLHEMPAHGPVPVTVPGAPAAWAALAEAFGRLPLTSTLKPAIDLARHGYPVSPVAARNWERGVTKAAAHYQGAAHQAWFKTFAPSGRAPKAGEIWRSEDHARTLEKIAQSNARDFYEGDLACQIHDFMKEITGFLTKDDLARYEVKWEKPLSINYRGVDVWELPPNGHGIVALMALNILGQFELDPTETCESLHLSMEAMKLAYSDGKAHIADPAHMKVTVEDLLSFGYAKERSRLIGSEALLPAPGTPPASGTVYLAAADGEGNMVSYIQSNYMGFGSGLVVPGTGIALHNRGHNFSMDPSHPNCVAPGKRPYHTIIPGFLTRDGSPLGPFGVMGGFMQPQGHLQVVSRLVDYGLNPQAALDAPRWQWLGEKRFEMEPSISELLVEALRKKGHQIVYQSDAGSFGRGQIILRNEAGTLCGATEPRTDGMVAVW